MDKSIHIETFTASSCMLSPQFPELLLTSSCTVHSRKFPTSHRYTSTIALQCYRVDFGIQKIDAGVPVPVYDEAARIASVGSIR